MAQVVPGVGQICDCPPRQAAAGGMLSSIYIAAGMWRESSGQQHPGLAAQVVADASGLDMPGLDHIRSAVVDSLPVRRKS